MKILKPISNVSLLIGLTVLVIFSFFTLKQGNADAASIPLLQEKTLEEKAIAEAQFAGLQDMPTAKRAVQMNLEAWLKLNDTDLGKDAAQFGLTPDMPVYVLAMRGNVVSRLAGMPRPKQTTPEQYDNITIVLDARTGDLMWIVTTREGFAMPVSVP